MFEEPIDGRNIIGISKTGNRLIEIPAYFMKNGGSAVITGDAIEPQDWSEFDGIGAGYTLEFHNTQKEIPAHAFEDDENLRAVTAPLVEKIGRRAFKYCFSLKLICFQRVQTIDKAAFHGCNSLKSVRFESAERISSQAFMECRHLEAAVFPKTRYIGVMAFDGCPSLKFVHIPCIGNERMLAYSGFIDSERLESIEINERNPRFAGMKALLEMKGLGHIITNYVQQNVNSMNEWEEHSA